MSLAEQITNNFPEGTITNVGIDKSATFNGENAMTVRVILNNGKLVQGTFTTESKPGFGGIEFSLKKDVVGLMTAKINSVLRGTAE